MTTSPDSVVREFIAEHRAAFLDDLTDWLRIPSVSADPARAGEVRRSAEWLAAALRTTGFPVAEVWETPGGGLPAVFAEWPSGDPAASSQASSGSPITITASVVHGTTSDVEIGEVDPWAVSC